MPFYIVLVNSFKKFISILSFFQEAQDCIHNSRLLNNIWRKQKTRKYQIFNVYIGNQRYTLIHTKKYLESIILKLRDKMLESYASSPDTMKNGT